MNAIVFSLSDNRQYSLTRWLDKTLSCDALGHISSLRHHQEELRSF